MQARPQELPFDPATLPGLSEKLLRSHHQNNYGGAVARLNAIRGQLAELAFASAPGFALNGLKREELIASNSMLLHELYFGSLGGGGAAPTPAMQLALAANFGSVERWREEFVAMGKALGGGSGWVLLVFQPREGSSSTSGPATTPRWLLEGCPSSRWTCTSTLTTSTTVLQRVPMWMYSWQTSTGRPSMSVTSMQYMPQAKGCKRRSRTRKRRRN